MKRLIFIILLIALYGCKNKPEEEKATYKIKDMAGRTVHIPVNINKIIALKSGALRLMVYMDCTDKIVAVEGNEKRRTVPYLFANPQFVELPVIGTGNIYEPELIAATQPDVIFMTYTTVSEANELEDKTGIPVILLNYGDFNDNIDTFFETITFLGNVLKKEKRANDMIRYIKSTIKDIEKRLPDNRNNEKVYVGGIAYRGSHGINSTEPDYAPFRFLKANNVASGLGEVTSSPKAWLENAFIDKEQLIVWNPDKIFLDVSGLLISSKDIEDNKALSTVLKAVKENELYIVLPHNWYTINYENVLCNTYYIGKVIYPEAFSDIDITDQCKSIYEMFLGKPVYDSMMNHFNAFRKYQTVH